MALAASSGDPWTTLAVIGGSVASYIFLVLLPLYFRDRSVAGRPDARTAHLRTAALLLLLVGAFLTVITLSLRLSHGWGAASILGVEAAAYFVAATLLLRAARRRSAKVPG